MVTKKVLGDEAEARALQHLQQQRLVLVQRNYRVAAGPRSRGGEIDLIMRERDGTLVFVEVRSRAHGGFGGAAGSIGSTKQRRLIFAAQCYLQRIATPPPCRFDAVVIDGDALQWLRGVLEAPG